MGSVEVVAAGLLSVNRAPRLAGEHRHGEQTAWMVAASLRENIVFASDVTSLDEQALQDASSVRSGQ